MNKSIAPSLKALLNHFIDYAGIFPPANVSLDGAFSNFNFYQNSDYAWMLHWLVLNSENAQQAPKSLNGMVSVVGDFDDERAAAIETKTIVIAPKPVYCEVSPGNTEQLYAVKKSGCLAKIRTGGLKPEAIPAVSDVTKFISDCADLKLAFKATAGLHHPLRAMHPLTYEADAPQAVLHGFLNVLLGSCFAWHGEWDIEPIIAEMDAANFSFDERAHWRDKSLSISEINDARNNFIHSVGSCSFEEPIHDLQALGLF